ncbi:MAG: DUF2207 domain-containing protein [Mollicutes bacterium]|nr:DUF2207 domain-containing protein [Mollicutes bacterium]
MKKILFFFLLFFCLIINVKADSINKISMDIYLDSYGTAHITETWDVNISSGTEGYKPYYNLGKAVITNFTVSNEEKNYQYVANWNVDDGFSQKAYKNGINYIDNGLELCWGISKYGRNIYTLKYDIKGFVAKATDKQMIYWTLIPHNLSLKPKEVNIVIWSDQKFADDIAVWGYGNYGGTAYVYDGVIEMNSDGELDTNEYMTILVELPSDMFQTNNILDKSFTEYYEMAEEGKKAYKESIFTIIGELIFSIIGVVLSFIPIVILVFVIRAVIKAAANKNFIKNISHNKFPKDLENFRDIPCNKDIFYAYFLANSYNLLKNDQDFLGALILSWIKNKYVTVELKEKKGLFKKTEEATLVMDYSKFFSDFSQYSIEGEMFNHMYDASKDGILEPKEFGKYCEKYYKKVLGWFDSVILEEKNKATERGLLDKLASNPNKRYETNKIYEEAKKLAGLRKFLKEFSSIEDKSSIEVHLWEYYLMYAQIFGIAEKVAEEFKRLYPDVITDMSYNQVIFVRDLSYSGMNSAKSANYKANNYSSGGGGFSSGGGGGGSFGGGGGGGGFR